MAQILSPVCSDGVRGVHSVAALPLSTSRRCSLPASCRTSRIEGCRRLENRRRELKNAVAVEDSVPPLDEDVADDYYAVLGVSPDATPQEIKKAYYNCMKECHPDLSGDDPEVTNFCKFINEVYEVLSDPVQRRVYDEIHGYALTAVNPFFDDTRPKDHVFVDEFSCIGCKNCANVAPEVFEIEEDFGRARVHKQCGKAELIQEAIDSCPVDCIHWTSAAQLSLLEDEMRRVERVNVGLMLAGMGGSSIDVFRMASKRWEKRQSKVLEKARVRMMKRKESDKTGYWSNLWGNPKDHQSSDEEAKGRAKRAAEAARRWREYSRRGADRRPKFKLPEAASKD